MFKLASSIGLALALAQLRQRIRHAVRSGILGAIGCVILVIAFGFLLIALHFYLSDLLNPIASAGIIGGVLLLIAVVLLFLASRPMRAKPAAAEAHKPGAGVGDALSDGLSKLGEMTAAGGSPIRNPLLQAAGIALVVGYLLGRRGRRKED
jgi:hypothetical protein